MRLTPSQVREYLTAEQLAEVAPWSVDAIDHMIRRGRLQLGVHYFQPFGRRSERLFKWAAIVALIEGEQTVPQVVTDVVDAPRGRNLRRARQPTAVLHVETAQTNLQRLLA